MIVYFPISTYRVFLQEGGTTGLGATIARKMIELHLKMPKPMFYTKSYLLFQKKTFNRKLGLDLLEFGIFFKLFLKKRSKILVIKKLKIFMHPPNIVCLELANFSFKISFFEEKKFD
jgi:hypothetical protein